MSNAPTIGAGGAHLGSTAFGTSGQYERWLVQPLVKKDELNLPYRHTLHFKPMVHDALQKEHTRGTNDIEPGVLAFAMQQHDTKSTVLIEQLRSTPFSTFINPD